MRAPGALTGRVVSYCGAASRSCKPRYAWSRRSSTAAPSVELLNRRYKTDEWTNITDPIISKLSRRLHLQPDHPLALTRKLICSRLPHPVYRHYGDLPPVVSTADNFDVLGFPADHPGRSRTDTYYVNVTTCLRTHTSAHQVDTFGAAESDGYTITADVYRRDAIDRSHYPVFHQMEGGRVWDRRQVPQGDLAQAVLDDMHNIRKHELVVEDPNPPYHPQRNPLQEGHTAAEVEAMGAHLKRTLEDIVVTIFSAVSAAAGDAPTAEPLQVRWIEAYFPFTSPSWELEVRWRGEWLELLGCGITTQRVLSAAGQSHKSGWAFGLGLERVAMLLYGIPDIRLFWSTDPRFLSQFRSGAPPRAFVPFSKHPSCYKDVSFWLPAHTSRGSTTAGAAAAGGASEELSSGTASELDTAAFHENDLMEIVREVAGDLVEDVALTDDFTHPKTGRSSRCYRINYRSLTETLTNERVNGIHERVVQAATERLGVEIR